MKKLFQFKLKIIAKLILAKYKPKIVGITGSLGKTSAKEAVYAVLSSTYRTRRSIKNFNNEIGFPLSIIGIDFLPGRSIYKWMFVFYRSINLILFKDKNFPEILVLEYGVDKPGDMDYLLDIAKCDAGIITNIGKSHLEFFGSQRKIQIEKSKLTDNLRNNGWSIFNLDDERCAELAEATKFKNLNFALKNKKADIQVSEICFSFEKVKQIENLEGISFKIHYKGSTVPVRLPDVIGYSAVYAALAGVAAGIVFDINLVKISQALNNFKMPPGRMRLINGIKNTLIIDDSYNSSNPNATFLAMDYINQLDIGKRKFIVLSDMLEMGPLSEEGHRQVGHYLAKSKIDQIILVGERSRDIGRGAIEKGFREDYIFYFSKAEDAGLFIQQRIKEGDLVFVKGSQGLRMEKIVKEIMADPLRSKELLVRQEDDWQ
jgi:UDP-N-acetylmuramoyl-tripeptide--D-alanyl-D-alanine ligase